MLDTWHNRTDKHEDQKASVYFLCLLYLIGFLLINLKSVEFIKRVAITSLLLVRGCTCVLCDFSMTQLAELKIGVNFEKCLLLD